MEELFVFSYRLMNASRSSRSPQIRFLAFFWASVRGGLIASLSCLELDW